MVQALNLIIKDTFFSIWFSFFTVRPNRLNLFKCTQRYSGPPHHVARRHKIQRRKTRIRWFEKQTATWPINQVHFRIAGKIKLLKNATVSFVKGVTPWRQTILFATDKSSLALPWHFGLFGSSLRCWGKQVFQSLDEFYRLCNMGRKKKSILCFYFSNH